MLFEPYRLWHQPAVFAYQRDDLRALQVLAEGAPPNSHLLYHCPGYDGRPFFARVAELRRSLPNLRVHLMANTRLELAEYRAAFDLPAHYGPVSTFVDERTFDIRTGESSSREAIYVARFEPGVPDHGKRLRLAREVRSLRILTYCLNQRHGLRRLFRHTFPELSHADVNDTMLGAREVAQAFAASRVQLALSAREGCMLAFTEGLLCGVPAVSTRCRSARTEFFNELDVVICDADPSSVARAVADLLARSVERSSVRARALARLAAMRAEYVSTIAALTGAPAAAIHAHVFAHPAGSARLSFGLPELPRSPPRTPGRPRARAAPA